ncbi:MAG: hypothetical protein AAGD13_14995 [Pseudomonadota bacterium]
MKLYYRLRKQGAQVFRMEVANKQRRIELNQIASITQQGEIVPHKRRPANESELSEIAAWWSDWKAREGDGSLYKTELLMAELNEFTNWIAKDAPAEEVDNLSDDLLTTLLDLRQTIVRRLSNIPTDEE